MKAFGKILFRFLRVAIASVLIIYLICFFYLQFAVTRHYSKSQISDLINQIEKAPMLSNNFYRIYDKLTTDRHLTAVSHFRNWYWQGLINRYSDKGNVDWQLLVASRVPYESNRYKVAHAALAFELNKRVSPERCFDFIMNERYQEYCKAFRIKDTVTMLKDTTAILSFLAAWYNPSIYHRWPTKHQRRTDSLYHILNTEL
jgi:hypothetical protein